MSENTTAIVIPECLARGMSIGKLLDHHIVRPTKKLVAVRNFLKSAYIHGCHYAGIL